MTNDQNRTSAAQSNLGPSSAPSPTSTPTPAAGVTIRPATLADAAAIADIGARVFNDTFAHTCTADDMEDYLSSNFTERVITSVLQDKDKTARVAVVDGQVASFNILSLGSSDPCVEHLERRIEIQRVYADTRVQGKGVAKALMESTIELCRKEGYKWAWLGVWEDNVRAIKFYEKFGFVKVGEHDFMLGSDRQTDYIFAKEL